MNWFYELGGERKGPVGVQDLASLVRAGTISDSNLVWREGLAGWQPLSAMRGEILAAAPAPPPPVPSLDTAVAAAPAPAPSVHYCAHCGQGFPDTMLANIAGSLVCVNCKPGVLQNMRQGGLMPGTMALGSIGARFVATLIDGVLLWIVETMIAIPIIGAGAAAGGDTAVLVATGLSTLVNLAISSGYEIFMIGSRGQTLGKMAMSLKVVRADGSALGYGLAAGRYFYKILSAIILMIGYLMALWDPEKRALHDRICETRVIKTK